LGGYAGGWRDATDLSSREGVMGLRNRARLRLSALILVEIGRKSESPNVDSYDFLEREATFGSDEYVPNTEKVKWFVYA
jgi:hypothetical protein